MERVLQAPKELRIAVLEDNDRGKSAHMKPGTFLSIIFRPCLVQSAALEPKDTEV